MQFVDWDSSFWIELRKCIGKIQRYGRDLYEHTFSKCDYPIVGNKELQKTFCEQFINYNGKNWEKLWNNRIRTPWCVGSNAWSQDMIYIIVVL